MFKFSYKFMFLLTLIFGTFMAISSLSWMGMWMGLEINLLSFIPLISNKKNIFLSESSLKYFLVQAIASAVFLFFLIFFYFFKNFYTYDLNNTYYVIISSAMLLKMGAAPFHFWFPSVTEGLSWSNNIILMTWQKIAPMMIISYCLNFNFLIFIIILCAMFGSLGGLNQTSLRKLMAYSSINHMGWMISSMLFNENLWIMYFFMYTFLLMNIIYFFNFMNLYFINQTFILTTFNKMLKINIFVLLLSLGGLPPFLGFFPKWMVLETMMQNNQFFLGFIMIMFTLLTLFFYIRITYSAFLLNNKQMNWNFKMNMEKLNNFNFNLFSMILFIANFALIMINLYFIF